MALPAGALILGTFTGMAGATVGASTNSDGWTTLAFTTGGTIIVALIGAYAIVRGRNVPADAIEARFAAIEGRLDAHLEGHPRRPERRKRHHDDVP